VTYRQFNYHLMMSHSTQLARWLHKQLVLKYTFASLVDPFEIRYSTIKRDSGLLENYSRSRMAIDKVEEAFGELKKANVISHFERKNVSATRRKLIDAIFTLLPSLDFIRDTKASSKRLSLAPPNGNAGPSGDIGNESAKNLAPNQNIRRPWV
jgi:hypothetical protein